MPIGYFNLNPNSVQSRYGQDLNGSRSDWARQQDAFFIQRPDGTFLDVRTGQPVDPSSFRDPDPRNTGDAQAVYDTTNFTRAANPQGWDEYIKKKDPGMFSGDFADHEDIYTNPDKLARYSQLTKEYDDLMGHSTGLMPFLKDLGMFFGPTIGAGFAMSGGLASMFGGGGGGGGFVGADLPWTSGFDLAGGGALEGMGGGEMLASLGGEAGGTLSGGDVWTSGFDLPGGGSLGGGDWMSGYDLPGGGSFSTTGSGTTTTAGAGGEWTSGCGRVSTPDAS